MDRNTQIIRTSVIGIVANVLLAAFKALVGILASSIAIIMDAVNNLSDALSSVITIVGTKLSERPADRKHPFGFGRIEYFSAIIIAVIVLSTGVTSLIESVKKIFNPTEPTYTTTTLIVIVVAIVVKLVLGQYVKRKGQQLKSDALIASGADALFDAVITLATLVSAGVMLLWHVSLDGVLGALISLVIIKAGVEMLASPVNELLGAKVSPELVSDVKREVMAFDGVHGVYDIILHNYGPNVMIGSLHISVPDTMTAYDIHGLTRKSRADLQKKVLQTLAAKKEIVQVHGFYYNENDRRLSVDVVPDITVHDDAALIAQLTTDIQPIVPDMTVTIVVDHNYSE